MMPWLRKPAGEPLAVSMSSIKLGDRLLVMGGADVSLIGALAGKAGLTGRAVLVDESEAIRASSARSIERDGVLIESFTESYSSLPFEIGTFDVVVMRNTLGTMSADRRSDVASEAHRILRPGGRCVVIEGHTRAGIAAWLGAGRGEPPLEQETLEQVLTSAGFRGVRTLARRERITFVEGVKSGIG